MYLVLFTQISSNFCQRPFIYIFRLPKITKKKLPRIFDPENFLY